MILVRRIGVMTTCSLVGIAGAGVHAWLALQINAFDGSHWKWVIGLVQRGDFRVAAAMGTIAVIWLLGTVAVGTVIVAFFVRPHEDYGRASWGGVSEAKKAGLLSGQGFVLGRVGGRILKQDLLATLVLGPTRTGKSVSVIIPTVLSLGQQSAFVHDLKGELAAETAGARERLGRVFVVNPRSGASAKWNPVSRRELPEDPSDMGDCVDNYWQFLIPPASGGAESSASKHFTDGGRVFGAAATLLLVYRAQEEGRDTTLLEVLRWLSGMRPKQTGEDDEGDEGDGSVDLVIEQLQSAIDEVSAKGWPERIAMGLARVLRAAKEERSSLVSTAVGALTPWLNEKIAAVSSSCTFSVRDYRGKEPITVYWKCPPFDAKTYGPLTGMHIEALVRFLTLEFSSEMQKVSLIIDEASFLPALSVIAEAPAIVLGYGVRILVAVQDVAQLTLKYGQHRYDAMIGNYGQRVVFPQNSLKTAKEISDTVGKATRTVSSGSVRGAQFHEQSESFKNEGKALIETSDLMSMDRGKVLILTQYRTQRPILADGAYFKKIRQFRRLAGLKLSPGVAAALKG
jgi:type IV secretion system protein VirD4